MTLLVTFGSIGEAFKCGECLKAAKYACAVIPEPRRLGVRCNYAVAIEGIGADDVDGVLAALAEGGVKYLRLFHES